MEAEANDAINKVIEMFTEILESKIGEFDVQSARKEIIKDLLEATADVLAAGGDYEKVEPAMEAALEWAKEQLTDAIKELKEAPAEEKEEKAKQVLTNAGNVILLGGDAEMVWEKVKTVLKWAEECLDDAINKLRTAPTEKKAQEVEKMATLVWKLSGNMAKVDIAIKTIEEWKSEVKQGER